MEGFPVFWVTSGGGRHGFRGRDPNSQILRFFGTDDGAADTGGAVNKSPRGPLQSEGPFSTGRQGSLRSGAPQSPFNRENVRVNGHCE